ncbi:tubulin-like doman-containing protein [Parabacteroides sp.]|uniref:tubulin-like doman-containing protein n=1 Tax=Parabacteroides sp. TaxID=1869337 RepID=UPI00257EF99E|nr:tubulin-like doman-containing protein [Parabacteroides sp.]
MKDRNIFIGLGGSGVNTIAALKYKLYANISETNSFDKLDEDYKFLFCDTDQADINKNNEFYKSKYEQGRVPLIDPENELVNLGEVNPSSVYQIIVKKRETERTDIDNTVLEALSMEAAKGLRGNPLSEGAGAFRLNSRIAFARKADEFKRKLSTKINQLMNVRGALNDRVQLRYWVVTGSNGGTGSGIFMDVLYLINMLHKTFRKGEEPKVTLIMYMPRFYIEANGNDHKYLGNAPAVFHEMDGFKTLSLRGDERDRQMTHQMLFRPQNLTLEGSEVFKPFLSVIPIDVQTERGNSLLSPSVMYANTAEMLYFIHQSRGQDTEASSFKSDADNAVEDAVLIDPLRYLMPMGYVSLRKPEDEFDNYIYHRLRVDLLSHGLLAPYPERKPLAVEIDKLYRTIVESVVFESPDDSLTFTKYANGLIDSRIEQEFSSNLLLEDGKKRNVLPASISEVKAELVIKGFTTAINDVYLGQSTLPEEIGLSKDRMLVRLEDMLWGWVEENVLKYGLNYVKTVLQGLDNYLTKKVVNLKSGNEDDSLPALSKKVESAKQQFADLRKKAATITLAERFTRSNHEDIENYYYSLKSYIQDSGDLLLRSKQCDLLNELCIGDNGIVDKIIKHIGDLMVAAVKKSAEVNKEYSDLATFFTRSALDITTIYLPEIKDFVKDGSWDPNNRFSKLYEHIMKSGTTLEPAYGFVPLRSNEESETGSVEAFFLEMILLNQEEWIRKGYYISKEKASRSNLFGKNRNKENPGKVIEDLIRYAQITYDKVYRPRLDSSWNNLGLGELFNGLEEEQQKNIRRMLNPQLFFSYTYDMIDEARILNYVIAPTEELAVSIFGYQKGSSDWTCNNSQSKSVAYMLKAKIGMRLSSYQIYDTLTRFYDGIENKNNYHMHTAWAECNGDYSRLRLKKRTDRDLLLFVKYLLFDTYGMFIQNLYYHPNHVAEKDHFSPVLLPRTGYSMSFPMPDAVERIQDRIALHLSDSYYVTYDCDEDLFYSGLFRKFKAKLVANRHEATLHNLLSLLRNYPDARNVYPGVKKSLVDALNQSWSNATRAEEKNLISKMVGFFGDGKELADYAKFSS